MTEEYFIRTIDNDENRGPFDMDQLTTLADAGKIDADTLVYLEGEGSWKTIEDVPDLHERLFPKDGGIRLRLVKPDSQKKQTEQPTDTPEEKETGVSVSEVLDSAEGLTADTAYLKRRSSEKHQAAGLSMPATGLAFLLFALAIGWSYFEFLQGIVNERNWTHLISRPLVFVFVVDVVFGLGLLLCASEIFPLVRFRAMLGLGFFGYFFWSLQGYDYAWSVFAFSMGVMLCTLTLNLPSMIIGILCLLGGSGYLAYGAISGDLPQYLAF